MLSNLLCHIFIISRLLYKLLTKRLSLTGSASGGIVLAEAAAGVLRPFPPQS